MRFPSATLLRPLSTIPNPNPNAAITTQWPPISRQISNPHHLNQFLSLAIVSGLFQRSLLYLWNSLLHSLSRSPAPSLAISLYDSIRAEGIGPDNYTFTSAIKAVSCILLLRRGEELHSLSLKLGFHSDTFVQNSLIHMYSACGSVVTARKVFDLASDSVLDVVSWNSMISGYLQSNLCEEALWVFSRMVKKSVRMDETTPVSALIACGRIGDLNLGRKIHALLIENGFGLDSYLGSSLVTMYGKCGAVEDAWEVFDRIPDKNVICWSSMISGYTQSGRFRESIDLLREMQSVGVKADDAIIASIVSSCAHLGALDQGRYVHAYCDVNGLGRNITVKNALIDMYSKCGFIEKALEIFQLLVHPDVFTWTTMISGLAMNGNCQEALDLFSQMEISSDVTPNEVTFLGVLSACSHGGFLEKGYYYFDRMDSVYKLKPRIEHFGCMVDLLGRAKLLGEAEKFIMEMPIKPDVIIWRSLLFTCRANGDVKLAEFATERILELEPRKCGAYVLLSNVYAVASQWSDVNRVRKEMNYSRIRKRPGCSFIEVNGVVHEFFASGKGCKQLEAIYAVLWEINKILLSEPYSAYSTDFFGNAPEEYGLNCGSWETTAYFRALPQEGSSKQAQLCNPTDTKQWMQPPLITPIKSMSSEPLKIQLDIIG